MRPECFAVMIINLLLFTNVLAAPYPRQDVFGGSDQIVWSMKIPVAKERVPPAEPETYNASATFRAKKGSGLR